MRKSAFLMLGVLCMLIACEKEETNNSTSNSSNNKTISDPIPLKVGNQWVYEYGNIVYDTLGQIVSKQKTGVDTISVIDDTLINDQVFYRVYGSFENVLPNNRVDIQLVNCKNGKLQKYDSDNESVSTRFISTQTDVPYESISDYTIVEYGVSPSKDKYSFQGKELERIYRIDGESYFIENDEVKRVECADANILLHPDTGILYHESFYLSCQGTLKLNKRQGVYKELVSFTTL